MTAAAVGGFTDFPRIERWNDGDGTTTLDATTDYVAFVFRVPATGTIDKIHHRIGSTTLNGTLSCQVQTLDANGDPSGSAYGSSAQVDVAVTGSEDNTQITFNSIACSGATVGDYACVKIWASAVTSGSVNVLTSGAITGGQGYHGFPYVTTRTSGTGAGTHNHMSQGPTIEYSGAVYYDVGWIPTTTFAIETCDADGPVRSIGNRLILPVPITVIGAWALTDPDSNTTSFKLYDTDGTTELGSIALVAANRYGTDRGLQRGFFAAPVNLSANTGSAYRIVQTTDNTAGSNNWIAVATAITAAHMAMMQLGTAMHYTSHNGTSWTDTTTKRAAIGLLVSKFEDVWGAARAYHQLGM